MNNEEKMAIFHELLEPILHIVREEYPQPNVTTQEYAILEGITRDAAYKILERGVDAGLLKKAARVKTGGGLCSIYWKA